MNLGTLRQPIIERHTKNYVGFIFCIWMLLFAKNVLANHTEINQVRLWPSPENTRVVFDLSRSLDCQVKTLPQSNRVTIELKNTVFHADLSKLDFRDSRIKSIKTKPSNKKDLNIEIELTHSLKPTVFSLAPNQTYGHRLVVDLEIAGNDNGLACVNLENERDNILALFEADLPIQPEVPKTNVPDTAKFSHPKTLPQADPNPTSKTLPKSITHNIPNSSRVPASASASASAPVTAPEIKTTQSATTSPSPSPVKVLARKPAPFIIAIDAGHGGEDPGAIGKRGTREKDVALAIAKQLKYLVDREPNMRAVLIRTGDYYIALQERVQRARRHHADLFISIHADAFHDRRAEGASVFTLSEKGASSAAARWLAARENRSDLIGGVKLKDKNKVLASVLLDLSQTKSTEEGHKAAHYILRSMGKIAVLHRGQVEQAGFAVLKAPDIPSLLVETGFISNLQGEAKLRNPQYQRHVAQAILNGVRHYVGQRHH